MPYEYFSAIFINDFLFNLAIVFFTMSTVLLLYKKNIYSLFDPLLFFLVFASAGYSVVFILYFSGYINSYYVIHFIITQLVLMMGFLLFKPIKLQNKKLNNHLFYLKITKRIKILYILSSIIYLTSHLILYSFKGIPLFMSSRLDATIDGFGIIAGLSSVASTIILSYLGYKFLLGFRFKFFDIIIISSFFLFSIFSGSKSTFLGAVFILFYVTYFLSIKLSLPKLMKKFNIVSFKIFLLALITLIIFTLLLTNENPFVRIIFRLIMTGDVFMMSYVDNNIDLIEGNFFNLVLPYRIIDILGLEHIRNIGNQLITIIYGVEQNSGPNARHNVLGYVAFGYVGSILFSFIIGLIMGFFRNYFIKVLKNNLESLIIFVLIVSSVLSLETDLSLAIFTYISKILFFSIFYLIACLINESIKQQYNKKLI